MLGDFNVDQLPLESTDPWHHLHDRYSHHFWERAALQNFMDVFGLQLNVPSRAEGVPGGPCAEAILTCCFSRIPEGRQQGVPSLLDYSISEPNIIEDSWLN